MPTPRERGVAATRGLRHQMLTATPHQAAGFRRIAQHGQRQKEGGIGRAPPPPGQEQRQRIGRRGNARHTESRHREKQHLRVAPLARKFAHQIDQDRQPRRIAQHRQSRELVQQRRAPGEDVTGGTCHTDERFRAVGQIGTRLSREPA